MCRLKKSLYGLNQGPRQWYIRFDTFMTRLGYSRNQYDDCIYFWQSSNTSFIYLLLHIDDMPIASRDKNLMNELKVQLTRESDIKDLGVAKKILGMETQRDRHAGKLIVSQ